jgi:integrase
MASRGKEWIGGYVTPAGVYVIRRSIQGKRYEVSTRCTTRPGANAELERFEADPQRYVGGGATDSLVLTEALCDEFTDWSGRPKKDGGKGNTARWVADQKAYLKWWRAQLGDRDIRKLDLGQHVIAPLAGTPARAHKIRVLKAFYSWLRTVVHRIQPAEDPTLDRLVAPQSEPAQVKAIDRATYEAIRAALRGGYEPQRGGNGRFSVAYVEPKGHSLWRDAIDFLGGTGWHVTELERFVRNGSVLQVEGRWVVETEHKSGEPHRTEVSEHVKSCAERLRAHGSFTRSRFDDALERACKDLGIPAVTPGAFRSSVATYAVNQGASMADVATFLGHKDPRTTRKWYAAHAVPGKVNTFK